MGKTLYLQPTSGISGDMVVGALLDLGANQEGLMRALASLGLTGYQVRVSRRQVSGLDCCDFDVVLDEPHQGHDHDMAYLYGNLDDPEEDGHQGHHHGHEDGAPEGHDHHHDHGQPHVHGHVHRTYADVVRLIDGADLAPRARATAQRIFEILAQAEARAHGLPMGQVHFHEVGAVDSIVDVVSAAYCLDDLDVTDCVVGPLAEGAGRVRCAHGVLPVPVPAVAHIAADHDLTLCHLDRQGEFVTPTGAAIAAAVQTSHTPPAAYRIRGVGMGSGKRDYHPVSTFRALVIEATGESVPAPEGQAPAGSGLWKLETEMDDVTGEALGRTLDLLYRAGVREAHYLPVYMKKNRPGYQVQVLCDGSQVAQVEGILFEETTTIGVRRVQVDRTALPRTHREVATSLGPSRVKEVTLPSGLVRAYPEHEAVVALSRQAGVSYQEALRATLAAGGEAHRA